MGAALWLASCSVSVSHPEKGTSVFDSHQPSEKMSQAFRQDLISCRNHVDKLLLESGLKEYRSQNNAIRQCLRRREGWQFHP